MLIRIRNVTLYSRHIVLALLFLAVNVLCYVNNTAYKFIEIAIICGEFLFIIFSRKKISFSSVSVFYGLFVAWCFVSSMWVYKEIAFNALMIITLIELMLIIYPNFIKSSEDYLVLSIVMVVTSLIISWYVVNVVGLSALTESRFNIELISSNRYGMIVAVAAVFLLYVIYETKKFVLFALYAILLPLMLASGSKSALFAFAFAFVCFYIFSHERKFKDIIKVIIVLAIAFTALIYVLYNVQWIYNIIGARTEDFINQIILHQRSVTGMSTSIRLDMITRGLRFFRNSPVIGYGFNNYRFLYIENGGYYETYAHNTFIELLVDLGIIGFLFYFLPRFIMFGKIIKNRTIRTNRFALGVSLLAVMFIDEMTGVPVNEIFEQLIFYTAFLLVEGEIKIYAGSELFYSRQEDVKGMFKSGA